MSRLLLLDEKEKLIVLGRRAEFFLFVTTNYEKNTCGNQHKKIAKKNAGHKFAAISGFNHQGSLYSVTVTFS